MVIERILFSKEECESIIALTKINQQNWNSQDRKFTSFAIRYELNTKWIFDRLSTFFEENSGYTLTSLKEEIHFHVFSQNNKFDIHNDTRDRRLFSVGVLLNDDFEDGDFKLYIPNEIKLNKKAGNCYLFNSSILHKVTPITNGIRYSLIWFIQNDNIKTTPNKII